MRRSAILPLALSALAAVSVFADLTVVSKGFPLASSSTVNLMGRKSSSKSEVTSIKEGAIPATAWEIRAGYRKVDHPMAKAFSPR